jgi:HEAT repeat protein
MGATSTSPTPPPPQIAATPPGRSADWPARLRDAAPGVRRVAILDAARTGTPQSFEALLDHLATERDPKARLLVIRALGSAAFPPAMAALASLRADPRTPPQESHAALLAHDAIEVAMRPPAVVVEDAEPAEED